MTKKELIDDMDFRRRCDEYSLDWKNFEIYGDIIILNTPKSDIYVLFNDVYDTIGIHNNAEFHISKEEMAQIYSKAQDTSLNFSYPFENLSLKQIMALSKRTKLYEKNHGHSTQVIVNGDLIDNENNEDYIGLLAYIKFLTDEIRQYFLDSYHMKMMGFDYPDVYLYIKTLMENVEKCIEIRTSNYNRTLPRDIIEYLGQNMKKLDMTDKMLYEIIDLSMRQKGFKVRYDDYSKIEPTEKKSQDLTLLSEDLLKILDLSDEELKQKEDAIHRRQIEMKVMNFRKWLTEDWEDEIEEELPPESKHVLTRVKEKKN